MTTFNLTEEQYQEYQRLMALEPENRTEETELRLEYLLNIIEGIKQND